MASLAGKVFVVTGSASGMGLATAKLLLSRGACLGLCDLNGPGLDKVVTAFDKDTKDRVISDVVNITDRVAVAAFLRMVKNRFGKLHGLANFAGVAGHKLGLEEIWEISSDEFDHIMDANVRGIFNLLAEALQPGVLEESSGGKTISSIVHISSMYSVRGYPNGAVFTASKHAAVGMVKSAAIEVGSRGIRVNAVMPGAVDTPMRQAQIDMGAPPPILMTPIERPGEPEEIATVVAFLLSDESSYVTGSAWGVDGGVNA